MNKSSLYNSLLEYKNLGRSSFHTPGHKGSFFSSYDLLSLDFTELPLTDSLYESSGIIKTAENAVSKLYETKLTCFSSGGNTLCIQAMIRLVANSGEKILCDRLVHRSVISAMALLNIQPIWIKRKISSESGLAESIDILDLKEKLKQNPDAKGLYLTSPSYHGILQDISLISRICKEYDIPVLVDNAHGSHLKFLGLHPLDLGASLTADSAHKTLPVLTAGAWLHINNEKFIPRAKSAMSLFGSTSPSYPIMASLDISREWLENYGKTEFEKLKIRVDNIKKLASEKGIYIFSDNVLCDPVRITLGVHSIGYTGFEFREELYKFKIEPELCDENYVVLIATPFNTEKDWIRLESAINNIKPKVSKKLNILYSEMILPKSVVSLSEAIMSRSTRISIDKCKNRIAADIVCPCPPGVPIVMPGEIIGSIEQKSLIDYGISEIDVIE